MIFGGAWKNNAQQAANGHFPDTYKKPNHPTFSEQSIYNDHENKGGVWGTSNGHDTFTPGPANLKNFSEDQLLDYFKEREPTAKLILPDDVKKESKRDTKTYDNELLADQETLAIAKEALAKGEQSSRQIAGHAKGMAETGKQHADLMAQLATSVGGSLQELKDGVAKAEAAIRLLQQQHRASRNNALN